MQKGSGWTHEQGGSGNTKKGGGVEKHTILGTDRQTCTETGRGSEVHIYGVHVHLKRGKFIHP